MERWIRPLPLRWGVVLGCGLLALSLGLASYRVCAEEKEKTETPVKQGEEKAAANKSAAPIKREDLTYGGKDFNEWRKNMLSELKASIRADGMKAFAAFGANGYGAEAAEAILEMMRGYDPDIEYSAEEDAPVVKAAYQAILKIRAAAVPALAEAVKQKKNNVRRFAIEALGRMRSDAQPALSALLQAFGNDDSKTRELAIDAVYLIGKGNKEIVAALIEKMNDKNQVLRLKAVNALGILDESAKTAVPALLKALSDKDTQVRIGAIIALQQIGAGAKAVPAVSRLLRDETHHVSSQAFWYLEQLKPEERKEAVPVLVEMLKSKNQTRVWAAEGALGGMGPTAKEAIPALKDMLRSDDPNTRHRALEALELIGPDDKR